MANLDGRCLCGGVSYSSTAEPMLTAVCHCTHCQRQSGAACSINVGVPDDSFELSGDSVGTYETVGEDNGKKAQRTFCSTCGSPLVTRTDSLPDVVLIKAGTLDDSSWVAPQLEIFMSSKQPWVPALEGVQAMQRGPG